MNNDFLEALGAVYGEPQVSRLLERVSIDAKPKLKRGDSTAYLDNQDVGIELTFKDADAIENPIRDYPEGALVLSNIRFYGEGSDEDFTPFADALPLGLAFGASYAQAVQVLGKEEGDDPDKSLVRWDFDRYCVFGEFEDDRLTVMDLQLPVAA